ncbi:MAG: hypothetical protein ABWX87_01520 [Pseudoxanthomonas sp.]
MRLRRASDVRLWLLVLCLLQVACNRTPPQAATPMTAAADDGQHAAAPAQAATPCGLITDEELNAVFAGAVVSRPEDHKAFGIRACEWNGDFGRLLVQQWDSKGHTPQDEMRDLVKGFIDTHRPGASQRVRLVPLQGLGNYATAVVEARDLSGGVLSDISAMSISSNGQTLVFLTDALDEQQREASLKQLSRLGRYAYARL